MFSFIRRKLKYLRNRPKGPKDEFTYSFLSNNLRDNIHNIQSIFGNSADIVIRNFTFGKDSSYEGALVFVDGLVDNIFISRSILSPLSDWKDTLESKDNLIEFIEKQILQNPEVKRLSTYDDAISDCLNGNTILFVNDCDTCLSISTKGFEKRAVTEPQSEAVVRGPREGYTENIRTNTSLIRRKIKSPSLRIENYVIGEKSKTNVALIYLEDVVNPDVLKKLRSRLKRIKVDAIFESGVLEEYIEDSSFSPFATIAYSEKPDVTAANILEGRIAIVVDGTPFVITVPMLFIESFQSAEDYYGRNLYTYLIRIVRYVAYLIAVFGPAFYISLVNYHQGLIPTTLLVTIINAREGTSFPIIIEIIIMLFAFEIMREAGIRLPRPMGQAISIVGALIMGEAAVNAGLVGAPVVIVVAITAVASFLIPNQSETIPVLRIFVLILATFAGLFGLVIGLLAILIHLASLTSFGVPYFSGFTRYNQDSIIRTQLKSMTKRPEGIAKNNIVRRGSNMKNYSIKENEAEDRVGVQI
ncbi:MAG TPA: spore germination protein [Bacilli bacterium]|nr:spore germination protein [Bacilli bacterium]